MIAYPQICYTSARQALAISKTLPYPSFTRGHALHLYRLLMFPSLNKHYILDSAVHL